MSPLVRLWLTQHRPRIDWVDLVDHAYACWRGLLHGLGLTDREWDPCEIDAKYLTLDGVCPGCNGQPRGGGEKWCQSCIDESNADYGPENFIPESPSPAFHTMLPCPVCHVSVGKDCLTRFGKVVGPHKARREAAAAQTAAEVQS